MLTQQRLYAKVIFDAQFAALHANAFQEFFQRLMQYRYRTFLPVVPYGSLGDQGSDGLSTLDDKLYAAMAQSRRMIAKQAGSSVTTLLARLRTDWPVLYICVCP